tara:strand:- start:289 stop:525 length:237 start_codon:yes stop_codon:yes gene_type:complete
MSASLKASSPAPRASEDDDLERSTQPTRFREADGEERSKKMLMPPPPYPTYPTSLPIKYRFLICTEKFEDADAGWLVA